MNEIFSTGRNWSRRSIEEIFDSLFIEGEGGSSEDAKYSANCVWVPCCDEIETNQYMVPLRLYQYDRSSKHFKMASTASHDGEYYYWMIVCRSNMLAFDDVTFDSYRYYFSKSNDVYLRSLYSTLIKFDVNNRRFGMARSDGYIHFNPIDVTKDEQYTVSNHPSRIFFYFEGNEDKKGWYEIINTHYGYNDFNIMFLSQTVNHAVKYYRNAQVKISWNSITQCLRDIAKYYFELPDETTSAQLQQAFPYFAIGTTGALKSDIEPEYITLKCPECGEYFDVKYEEEEVEPGEEPEPVIYYCPYCGAEVEYTPPAPPEPPEGEEEDPDDRYYFYKPFNIKGKIRTHGPEEEEEPT